MTHLVHVRNDKSKLYFETSCIMAWNSVPDSLKSTFTYNKFIQKFKNYLFDPTTDTTTNPTAAHGTNTNTSATSVNNSSTTTNNDRSSSINNNRGTNNIDNTSNINIHNQFDGIAVLRRRRRRNEGRLDDNWNGQGLETRWDN